MGDLNDVLDRAQTDFDFYLALQANPDAALAPYTLTQAEREVLRDPTALWRLVSTPAAQGVGDDFGANPPPEKLPAFPDGPPELVDGPVEGPPVEGPPVEGPPVEGPPVEGPPVEGPPIEGPPVEGPPVEGPPIGIIPVTPIDGPPIDGPPIEGPPVGGIGIHGPGGISVGVSPVVSDPVSPGIVGVIHFLTGPEVTGLPDIAQLQDILANRAVVSAVQRIRAAADSQARLAAVNDLMREIG